SKRSRAFSGWMKTIGPRSVSRALVERSRATRNGRFSVSSATVCSHDYVVVADLHNESAPPECLHGAQDLGRGKVEPFGQLRGRGPAELPHRLPHAAFFG